MCVCGRGLLPAGQLTTELTEQDKQTHIHLYRKLEEPIYPKICVFGVWKEARAPGGNTYVKVSQVCSAPSMANPR